MLNCLISLLESARTAISDWSDYHQQGLPVNSAEHQTETEGWLNDRWNSMDVFCGCSGSRDDEDNGHGQEKGCRGARESDIVSRRKKVCVALKFSNSVNWELFDQTKGDCRNGRKTNPDGFGKFYLKSDCITRWVSMVGKLPLVW